MARADSLEDSELLTLLRDGNDAAFKQLYLRYQTALYNFLFKFLKSAELTEDICQEIFIQVWSSRAELPLIVSFKSYLFTIGKNRAFNFLKRAAVDENAKSVIVKNYATEGNTLESNIHTRDYERYLTELLNTLSPQSREVFRLCRQEGKSYDEAAALLGISRNTVKKHMMRSMRNLSDSVERDLGISMTTLLVVLHHIHK